MKIKKGCKASTSDFWYDLSDGGYLKPKDICADAAEAEKVEAAVNVILDFQESCEDQIKDFLL